MDDKSNGFQLESSLVRDAAALTRLCFVLAVATLYLVAQGTQVVAAQMLLVDPHSAAREFVLADRLAVGQNRARARLGVVCHVALEWGAGSRTVSRLGLTAHGPTGGDFYPDDLLSPIIVLSIKQWGHLSFRSSLPKIRE